MRVLKMTSQRTSVWNFARRQLAKSDFGVCERYIFFFVVARRELIQKLIWSTLGKVFLHKLV